MYKAFTESEEIKKIYYIISRTLPATECNYLFIIIFFLSIDYNTTTFAECARVYYFCEKKIVYEHTRQSIKSCRMNCYK